MTYTIIVHLRASSLENAEKLREKLIEAASVYRKGKHFCSSLPPLSSFSRNYSYYDEFISYFTDLFFAVVYTDKETMAWLVHQDPKEPTKFAIVERFENEASQTYHLENPVRFHPSLSYYSVHHT